MGQPAPKWMQEYMRLTKELDELKLKTDILSKIRLRIVAYKIMTLNKD
jgi:hypothetical protein